MIKYVLVFIAAVLVTLGIYTYSNQANEKSIQKPSISTQKEEPKETKQISLPVVKDTKTVLRKAVVTSPKVVSKEAIQKSGDEDRGKSLPPKNNQSSVADFSKIGEGLTLESIKNSNVSEHEKELMLEDLAIYQNFRDRNNPVISKEEGIKALRKEFN